MKQQLAGRYAVLALIGLSLFGGGLLRAENEPGDNTVDGATVQEINGTPAVGSISNSDTDCYRITNQMGDDFVRIDFSHNGSGPDRIAFRVLGPNSTTTVENQQTTARVGSDYVSSHTIMNPTQGAVYLVCVGGNGSSADGTKQYTLRVTGSSAIVDPVQMMVSNSGTSYTVDLTAVGGWTVSGIPTWATVAPASGSGNAQLTVTVESNPPGGAKRVATLLVGGAMHVLTQDENLLLENEPNDTVSEATNLTVGATAEGSVGGNDKDFFRVTTTEGYQSLLFDFEFGGSGPDSLRFKVLSGSSFIELTNQQVTSSTGYAATYMLDNPPMGSVFLVSIERISTDGTKSYTIRSTGVMATTDLAIDSLVTGSEGESTQVSLTSNTGWSVTGLPAWVTVSPMSGRGDATLTITLSKNTDPQSRTATIMVNDQSLRIEQGGQVSSIFIGDGYFNLGGWRWTAGLGFFYDGFYPFVWVTSYQNWLYIFGGLGVTDQSFFVYDFARGQFGWMGQTWYPVYVTGATWSEFVDLSMAPLAVSNLWLDPISAANNLSLRVRVLDSTGTGVTGATVTVDPQMPIHGHGSSKTPIVVEGGGGDYFVSQVFFTMSGPWEVTITATKDDRQGTLLLRVDVP